MNSLKHIKTTARILGGLLFAAAATGAPASAQAVFLRGTHNGWTADPMLYQGYYQARDIVTFSDCDTVELKFDAKGDWSENYGDDDNVRGYNPSRDLMEGHLDRDGANISVACGQTYFISMNYSGQGGTYGLRALDAEVPSRLPEGTDIALRKAIRGGGFYGAVSITGELLVRPLSADQAIEIRATDSQGDTRSVQASLFKTLPDGLQLWRFSVGSYGSIDLDSITYRSGGVEQTAELTRGLIQ